MKVFLVIGLLVIVVSVFGFSSVFARSTKSCFGTAFDVFRNLAEGTNLRYSPHMYDPGGPTYGCWPTGAICGYNCDKTSAWCLAYCLILGFPTMYYCEAGCQYMCVTRSGSYLTCRDIRPIGCLCDVQLPECPTAG